MPTELSILERLETLEKQNRRFKQIGFGGLLVFAAAFTIAAVPQSKDARFGTIEADKIIVRNNSGDELTIWAHDGTPEGIAMDICKQENGKKVVLARFADFGGSGQFSVNNLANSWSIMAMGYLPEGTIKGAGKGPGISVRGDSPYISLMDDKKYQSILGSAFLESINGTDLGTTAGSIHLFDNKGKVIWQAP